MISSARFALANARRIVECDQYRVLCYSWKEGYIQRDAMIQCAYRWWIRTYHHHWCELQLSLHRNVFDHTCSCQHHGAKEPSHSVSMIDLHPWHSCATEFSKISRMRWLVCKWSYILIMVCVLTHDSSDRPWLPPLDARIGEEARLSLDVNLSRSQM